MLVDSIYIYIYLFYVTNMNLIRSPLTDDVHWFSHLLYIPWISHETTIIEPWYPHRKNWNITNWWFFASKNALNPMKSPLKSLNLHVYRWFSEPSSISPSVRRQSVPLQVQPNEARARATAKRPRRGSRPWRPHLPKVWINGLVKSDPETMGSMGFVLWEFQHPKMEVR